MLPETAARIAANDLSKGDVLGVARIAAIQAAKRTAELVPYAQDALLGAISVEFSLGESSVAIEVSIESRDGTSAEMAALTGCSIAALTIYDMCKAIDRAMTIGPVALIGS